MGWKDRGGRAYYYRSRREGGRVRSEYVGAGASAALIARIDQIEQTERALERAELREEREAAEAEDRAVAAWFDRIEEAADAAMLAAGYHKRKGQWRRRRHGRDRRAGPGEATRALLKRASKGDESCLPELRALLADPERGGYLVEACGSPAAWLENDLIAQAAGKDLAVREATRTKLSRLRDELAGPAPTPIERLLAERAAVCWFLVSRYESNFANAQELTIRQAEFHQRKIDRAHARYLAALQTLARVRKLALPALQVNIARNQINVAGGPA